MRVCVIHTGLHKTGSSSLQNFLHVHSKRLLQHGILYSGAGRFMNRNPSVQHQFLIRSILDDPSNLHGDRPARELSEEVRTVPHRTLVISAEFISLGLFAQDDLGVVEHLRGLGYRPVVVTCIRPQEEVIVSKYTQRVKNFRATEDFGTFFDSVLNTRLHQYHRMQRLLEDAGIEHRFIPYDRELRKRGIEPVFLDHLLAIDAGLEPERRARLACKLAAAVPPRLNESVGPVELALCRTIAREINPDGRLPQRGTQVLHNVVRSVMRRAFVREREPYRMMDAAFLARVLEAHAGPNEAFARRAWGRGWTETFGEPVAAPAVNDLETNPDPKAARLYAKLLPRVRAAVLRQLERRQALLAGEAEAAA